MKTELCHEKKIKINSLFFSKAKDQNKFFFANVSNFPIMGLNQLKFEGNNNSQIPIDIYGGRDADDIRSLLKNILEMIGLKL